MITILRKLRPKAIIIDLLINLTNHKIIMGEFRINNIQIRKRYMGSYLVNRSSCVVILLVEDKWGNKSYQFFLEFFFLDESYHTTQVNFFFFFLSINCSPCDNGLGINNSYSIQSCLLKAWAIPLAYKMCLVYHGI